MATLLFHAGALGDSVLTWPLIRHLDDVVLVTSREKGRLARRWLDVTAVDGDHPDFSRLFVPAAVQEVSDAVRQTLAAATQICSFISDGRDAWAQNVRKIAPRVPLKALSQRPPAGRVVHVVTYQFEQVRGDECSPIIMPPRRDNLDGPVVIHPGSGAVSKCWPAERFARLIEHYHALGRPVQVVIGEVEIERGSLPPQTLENLRRAGELVEHADLMELSEVISRAALFIGNDSGPTHLAAQLGIPTLALFGPTDPRIWAPVGPAVRVLHPGDKREMTWLSLEQVIEAAAAM